MKLQEEKTFSVVCVRATVLDPSIWSQIWWFSSELLEEEGLIGITKRERI